MKAIPPEERFDLKGLSIKEIAILELGLLQLKGELMFDLLLNLRKQVNDEWEGRNKKEKK